MRAFSLLMFLASSASTSKVECYELFGKLRHLPPLLKLLPRAGWNPLDIAIDPFKGDIFIQQLDSTFFPYALDPGDIVGGVPQKGKIIDYLIRMDREVLIYLTRCEERITALPFLRRA